MRAYQSGLVEFRAGRMEASYGLLGAAYAACPGDTRFRNDFIVAAVGALHPAEALAIAAPLYWPSLPVYVLESLGRAARDAHEPELAIRFYDTILAREPDVGAQVGRDLAEIDAGAAAHAHDDLEALLRRAPGRIDVLEALGLADEALGRTIDALAVAEEILAHDPHHVGALQLRFRMLLRGGAPQLALARTPLELIAGVERDAARRDVLAFEFRFVRDAAITDRERANQLDGVIDRMRTTLADPGLDRGVRDGLRGDLVEVLAERGRAREATREFEDLRADGILPPPSVTGAAAGAYLAQKQPERAAALIAAMPADAVLSYGVKADYFYALLESGRYAAAVAWADRTAAEEPVYHYARFPGLRTDNGDYGRALVLTALARTYTDVPAQGELRLAAVLDTAPADPDARLALAQTQAARGWPRQAAYTASGLILEDPESNAPLAQLFGDQLAMGDWRGAYATLTLMHARLPPDNAALLQAQRDWDTHQMNEIIIDGHLGWSFGGRAGVIDSEIDEYLYSTPIEWDWRAYVHLNQTLGDPVEGRTFLQAAGVGLEYHTRDWLGTLEVLEIDGGGPYPQFSLEATPDDHLSLGAAYAVRTLDTPIAAVVTGVHADRLALNLDYRVSEARDFGAEAAHEQFSDGNSRLDLAGYWRERWITGPIYKLDTRLDLDTSQNTLGATNYFNPRRDFAATLTFENQWLQFRHYDRSLSHELDVGFGDYIQQGYGQIVYEVNDRLTLKAGVGTTVRPFDGQRERLDVLTFHLTGRF
jgi:biofilm PGA synthesis protein PgaA